MGVQHLQLPCRQRGPFLLGAHSLGYVGLGVRTTYPLALGKRETKLNVGQRPPRMDDARAETKEPWPQAGWAYIRGPVTNGVCLCWPLFVPDGASLTDWLNRHRGLFFDSASTLFWGGEWGRSRELPEDNSSSVGGSLSPMRMGSLPLFG